MKRARDDQHQDVHESDEELRFFSQRPEHDEEHTLPSAVPSSLSPTTRSADGDDAVPLDPWQRAELARFEARRTKLKRRVIATLWGAASLLVLAVAAQQRVRAERQLRETASASKPVAVAVAAQVEAPRVAQVVTPLQPPAQAVTAPPEAVTAPPEAVTPATEQDSAALINKARDLLRGGHSRDGVAAAREAVAQAPLEAEPYVLLGAGLQDLGDYGAARTVFAECLQKATHGPSATCRYFARH